MAEPRDNIVIIGGGVVGCCTAYYLTRHPSYDPDRHAITLLEATRLAAGASGKAGGLLAQWAYPASLVSLSFDLHRQLAADHDGPNAWGYRAIRCGKLTAHDPSLPDPARLHDADEQRRGGGLGLAAWAARQLVSGWKALGKRREVDKDPAHLAATEQLPDDLDWFRADAVSRYEDIAPAAASETAQVHPHQFTTAMARLAEERGARILTNSPVEELLYEEDAEPRDDDDVEGHEPEDGDAAGPRRIRAVSYVDRATGLAVTLPATTVVLAAGPWAPTLFPMLPMSAIRAHSVTIRPRRPLPAYCLFTEVTIPRPQDPAEQEGRSRNNNNNENPADDDFGPPNGAHVLGTRPLNSPTNPSSASSPSPPATQGTRLVCPEVYTRPNNEVYVAGEGDTRVPLPPCTDDVEVDRAACQLLVDTVAAVSDDLRDGVVTGRRACYLPTVDLPSGGPLIGPTWVRGLLLATGHSCWGIHNAPATGKLVAEMVLEGRAVSADIEALDPHLAM